MLLAIYLIIIFIGSIVLNIKFNAIVIVVYVSSIFIAYIIFRKSIYLRLIRDFKKLNNNLLEINEENIEFISKNQTTKLNRNDIKAIYSLKNTFFIVTQGYYRNELKRKVYFFSAIPKSIFNLDEDYNLFFNSLDPNKIK